MPPFPEWVIDERWQTAVGCCECRNPNHPHHCDRACRRDLSRCDWDAHHANRYAGDSVSNCRLLCVDCHYLTRSYGRPR